MPRTATPELALQHFDRHLSAMARHGEDQVSYAIDKLAGEFFNRSLRSFASLAIADIKAKHAAIAAGETVPGMARVDIQEGNALSVQLDDGRKVLVAWWEEVKLPEDAEDDLGAMRTTNVGIIPFHDRMSDDLIASTEALISGTPSAHDAAMATRSIMNHGGLNGDDVDLYGDLPLSLDEIVRLLPGHGLDHSSRAKGLGVASIISFDGDEGRMPQHSDAATNGCRDIDLLATVSRAFSLSEGDRLLDHEIQTHAKAMMAGQIAELHDSVLALAMRRTAGTRMAELETLISLCRELGLSRDLVVAYNDTDIRVHAETTDDRAVILHENIDLIEGNAFVVVLEGSAGARTAIHAYAVDAINDYEDDEPLDAESSFAEKAARLATLESLSHRIGERELLEAIDAGERPEDGRILSFDIASGTLEIFPAIERTDFVTYLPLIAKYGVQRLQEIVHGDAAGDPGIRLIKRDGDVHEMLPIEPAQPRP